MEQFDVFRNPNAKAVRTVPWLLVVQSGLLDQLPTRLVAPLVRPAALMGLPASRLNPTFSVGGDPVVMLTQQLGAVPTRSLSHRVASLADRRSVIIAAVDFLLSGV